MCLNGKSHKKSSISWLLLLKNICSSMLDGADNDWPFKIFVFVSFVVLGAFSILGWCFMVFENLVDFFSFLSSSSYCFFSKVHIIQHTYTSNSLIWRAWISRSLFHFIVFVVAFLLKFLAFNFGIVTVNLLLFFIFYVVVILPQNTHTP